MNPSKTLDLARALIQRRSVTPQDDRCQVILAKRLEAMGFNIEHLPFEEVSNLWARRGDKDPLVVFAGHTDVVPPGPLESWKYDPFSAVIDEDYLHGRGAADMKSSLAAFITAIEEFLSNHQNFTGSIGLLITSDEEGPALHGTARVVDVLQKRGETIDYCIVGEPSSEHQLADTIKNGRRGSLNGVLKVIGVQGHVAYPHLADNPVHRFAPALAELTATQWDNGNEYFPATTFQISSIFAGTEKASNVIPEALQIHFNFRFSSESTPGKLKQKFEQILKNYQLNYQLQWNLSGLPFITPKGDLVDATTKAVEKVIGITPVLSTAGGTSDGRFIAPTGAQVIELGPVNRTIHKINECVRVDDLEKLSKIYCQILANLLSKPM